MGVPGGSALGNIAKRNLALRKQARVLSPAGERGAPQAPTRAMPQPPPPPSQPAQPPDRETMKQQAEEFLTGAQARQQKQVPPPAEGPIRTESVRPPATEMLSDRVNQLGAAERPLETQFYRLAGRMGSPRELAILAGRMELERQLKRPPTANEMRSYIARPASLGPAFSPAVEGTPAPGAAG